MPLSEREKMLSNQPYYPADPELVQARREVRVLLGRFNTSSPLDIDMRHTLLKELLGAVGEEVWIEPPFYCDYGTNIYLGSRVYFNFNCVILDCNRVEIGSNCKFGPGVHLYTAYHPLEPTERASGVEGAASIRIGENVWIGGGAIVGPGVEIGADTVIGAGSVVTRDLPARVVAVGNPCRVIREL
ncbi:MAG: sugar O-acetyltransferase [Phycisphaerales bacterium]|nr:sugar O-acetyltransferase [Phycisphaerales bacterium]